MGQLPVKNSWNRLPKQKSLFRKDYYKDFLKGGEPNPNEPMRGRLITIPEMILSSNQSRYVLYVNKFSGFHEISEIISRILPKRKWWSTKQIKRDWRIEMPTEIKSEKGLEKVKSFNKGNIVLFQTMWRGEWFYDYEISFDNFPNP